MAANADGNLNLSGIVTASSFQEVEQMNLFKDMVCYQEEVRDPSRMAEVLNKIGRAHV